MEDITIPKDDPIAYFKSNFQEDANETPFNSIFIGCPKPSSSSLWVLFSIALGVYFVLSLFVSNILLIPMSVEGSSMYPTLNYEYSTKGNTSASDVVYLWETQNVQYKDIVVFNATPYNHSYPQTETVYYIKRVIATSGDTIQFKKVSEINGIATYDVIKNNAVLIEDYVSEAIQYNIQYSQAKFITNEQVISIPEGYVFVLGDNRNNSRDSRDAAIGLVDERLIAGKVYLRVTPFDKFGGVV